MLHNVVRPRFEGHSEVVPSRKARRAFLTACGLIACSMLAILSTGCAMPPEQGHSLPEVQGVAQFQQQVLNADRPVMIEFFKVPCPTCDIEQAKMEQLSNEYAGKVKFYRFQLANVTWDNLCPEIKERYKLFWVPSVLLFYNGWERHRWELNHPIEEYRLGLNEIVAEAARKKPTSWPAATPAKSATPAAPAPLPSVRPGF
jgi:thioredoxin 1